MLVGCGSAVGQDGGPSVASGAWVPVSFRAGVAGSGWVGEGAETSEDLGEQVLAGWQAQGVAARVADQAGGDGEQPPPQGGDHGLAAADAVSDQLSVVVGGG